MSDHRADDDHDEGPTDASGAPLVSATIVCVDCGSTAHLMSYPDETGRFWPGDLVTYRCEDCMDRWDLIVPGDDPEDDHGPGW